jgi:hypothetical protein
MCRSLVAHVATQAELPASATPEIRGLFDDWLEQIEAEIEEFLEQGEEVSPERAAAFLGISSQSAAFLLRRAARRGKALSGYPDLSGQAER